MGRRKGKRKLIISSDQECIVGEILVPTHLIINDQYVEVQPIRIVRVSTKEEYLKHNPQDSIVFAMSDRYKYFYEIESD